MFSRCGAVGGILRHGWKGRIEDLVEAGARLRIADMEVDNLRIWRDDCVLG